jgi:hypothetical protein
VASKLRTLPKEQRIIAEKIINDVLYEPELGTLTRNSILIVNEPHGCSSPMVHSHCGTRALNQGSGQHAQCNIQRVDQESVLHTYFLAYK